jgi:hypothetical protein
MSKHFKLSLGEVGQRYPFLGKPLWPLPLFVKGGRPVLPHDAEAFQRIRTTAAPRDRNTDDQARELRFWVTPL